MKRDHLRRLLVLKSALIVVFMSAGTMYSQTPNAWGYSTGYGNVYGTYGLAQTMQSMYNVARAQSRQRAESSPASRPANNGKTIGRSTTEQKAKPPRPALNYGLYVPDPAIDTGKAFADALGETVNHMPYHLRCFLKKSSVLCQASLAASAS
jgi:hypothetical protein